MYIKEKTQNSQHDTEEKNQSTGTTQLQELL